jgi:hypothetical protein
MKTAKVTGVLACKPFDGRNGRIWYHKLELDNGEVGEIGKKTENAFKIGDTLSYTSETSEYGLKFKAVTDYNTNGGGGFKGGARGSNASFALSYCKDITVALIPLHPDKTPTDWTATTLAMADKFNNWLKEHQD